MSKYHTFNSFYMEKISITMNFMQPIRKLTFVCPQTLKSHQYVRRQLPFYRIYMWCLSLKHSILIRTRLGKSLLLPPIERGASQTETMWQSYILGRQAPYLHDLSIMQTHSMVVLLRCRTKMLPFGFSLPLLAVVATVPAVVAVDVHICTALVPGIPIYSIFNCFHIFPVFQLALNFDFFLWTHESSDKQVDLVQPVCFDWFVLLCICLQAWQPSRRMADPGSPCRDGVSPRTQSAWGNASAGGHNAKTHETLLLD